MRTLLLILAFVSSVQAADLINETFADPALPKNWTTGGRKDSWSVVDGTLQGACDPTDDHGPSISAPLVTKNAMVTFRIKREAGSYALMLIDGESAFGGQAHLLRVAVSGDRVVVAQDRGSPKSHADQAKARTDAKKAGQPPPPKPTPLQLSDPWFYRTEQLASATIKKKPEEWLKVEVIVHGNSVTVTLDDNQMVTAKATILDAQKSKLVFLAGNGKKLWLDDIKATDGK